MNRITIRLSPDLVRRFDAAATARGGRSRLLRSLMSAAANAELLAVDAPVSERLSGKISLRLTPDDLAALEGEAAAQGLSRTQWTTHLIRRRLYDRPQLSAPDALALIEIRRELRRIGVNINQIARALNTAILEGQVLSLELDQVSAYRAECEAWVEAIGEALKGNLAYWSVEP